MEIELIKQSQSVIIRKNHKCLASSRYYITLLTKLQRNLSNRILIYYAWKIGNQINQTVTIAESLGKK